MPFAVEVTAPLVLCKNVGSFGYFFYCAYYIVLLPDPKIV